MRPLRRFMKLSNRYIFRLLGIGVLAILLWVSIAYIVPYTPGMESRPGEGEYRITSLQEGNERYFEGPVYFEFADRHSGIKNSPVFKLHFINTRNKAGRGFGFVIPLRGNGQSITQDIYEVTSRNKRFASANESVFGYADLILGEDRLFFTESGSISINQATDLEVSGKVDMLLTDAEGNSMKLVGQFNALPLNSVQNY